jgi:hypothetical protein
MMAFDLSFIILHNDSHIIKHYKWNVFCFKSDTCHFFLQIQAIDKQIAKLERDMVRGNRRGGLFAIKDAIEALQMKKSAIYEKMLNDQ